MRRFTVALFAIASLASACADHSHDYEVITGFDTGPIQDVRADRGSRPDIQDTVDDDAGEMDTGPLSDGGQNGTCAGGDAATCSPTPHAVVTCESERCIYRCLDGYEDCDGNPANGCEVQRTNDVNNCGSCGHTCTGGALHSQPVCQSGICGIDCTSGYGDCDNDPMTGCEVDMRIDPMHCGTCTTMCATIPNADAICTAGVCMTRCHMGFTDCDPSTTNGCETNTATDLANCGACGTTCMAGAHQTASCADGVCNRPCDAGFGNCDGMAANGCETTLMDNPMACGSCTRMCPSGPNSRPACSSGTCSIVCDAGFADCDGNATNGCEVNLATSASHCGSCAVSCAGATNATPVCASMACGLSCNPNFADCDMAAGNGCEINTTNDRNNCGACNHVCTGGTNATATCTSSVCGLNCQPGFTDCDRDLGTGCEINTAVSTTNCGTCGTVCTAGPHATPSCTTGVCGIVCIPPYRNCDGDTVNGCELDASSNPTNCGACGNVCPGAAHASPACTNSVCALTCDAGFLNCDGNAANGCEVTAASNVMNCGACGTVCTAGPNSSPVCASGTCSVTCTTGFLNCDGSTSNGCEYMIPSGGPATCP